MPASVTRLGDLLDFGQVFKAFYSDGSSSNLPKVNVLLQKVAGK